MRVNGISNNVSASGISSGNVGMQTDSYTKNIQKQIADAQQRLQNLSANQDLSLEEKMKKRQEIQQEIANLNQQLRQHQIELRKEQQNNQADSADQGITEQKNTSSGKDAGLSQAGMQSLISADSSIKLAGVQQSTATRLDGKARVLKSEIKQDEGKGNTEKKEQELSSIQEKAQQAQNIQMSILADGSKSVKEVEETDHEKVTGESDQDTDRKDEEKQPIYTPIDVRL